jgi:hypothetical protein
LLEDCFEEAPVGQAVLDKGKEVLEIRALCVCRHRVASLVLSLFKVLLLDDLHAFELGQLSLAIIMDVLLVFVVVLDLNVTVLLHRDQTLLNHFGNELLLVRLRMMRLNEPYLAVRVVNFGLHHQVCKSRSRQQICPSNHHQVEDLLLPLRVLVLALSLLKKADELAKDFD